MPPVEISAVSDDGAAPSWHFTLRWQQDATLCSLQTELLDQIVSRFGVIFLPQFEEHFGGTPQRMAGLLRVVACGKRLSENHTNHCDTASTSEFGHNVVGLDDARDRVIELLFREIKLCQAHNAAPIPSTSASLR